MTENRMTPKRFTVIKVAKENGYADLYQAWYYNEDWKLSTITVNANDDIDAIFIGTRILRAKQRSYYLGIPWVFLPMCGVGGFGSVWLLITLFDWFRS